MPLDIDDEAFPYVLLGTAVRQAIDAAESMRTPADVAFLQDLARRLRRDSEPAITDVIALYLRDGRL